MKKRSLVLAAYVALLSGWESSAGTVSLKIKEGERDMGRIYVPVRVGNYRGFMRLDTGASSSRVFQAAWNKDLPVIERIDSISATGKVVTCDSVEVHNVALEANGVANVGRSKYTVRRCPTSDGENLLGLDFFSGAHIVFDFDQRMMEVGPEVKRQIKGPVHRLPILESGQPLAAIPLNTGSGEVLGMLDSGAEMSAVDSKYIAAHPENFEYAGEVGEATDAGGNSWAPKFYRIKNLNISGTHELHDVYVLAYDFGSLREVLGPQTPIVLGFNIMSKFNWAFDLTKGHSPTYQVEPRGL